MTATHLTTPTRFIEVDGDRFAYRRWGKPSGVRVDQDPPRSAAVAQAQAEAHAAYLAPLPGENPYAYLSAITQPTLVLNGVNDIMIASINRHPVPGGVIRSRISVKVKRGQHR